MPLSNTRFISSLRPQNVRQRTTVEIDVRLGRAIGVRKCTCHQCPTCIDNLRWEKIFNEKFADPDYYRPRAPRMDSSLGVPKS